MCLLCLYSFLFAFNYIWRQLVNLSRSAWFASKSIFNVALSLIDWAVNLLQDFGMRIGSKINSNQLNLECTDLSTCMSCRKKLLGFAWLYNHQQKLLEPLGVSNYFSLASTFSNLFFFFCFCPRINWLLHIYSENLMLGYRLVFDRENLKLGWSHSNCKIIFCNPNIY